MKNNVCLKLKSPDKITIQLYIFYINKLAQKFNIKLNIVNLFTKQNKITLLKSPHVNKKAREQFELKIYNTIVNFDKSFINNVFITHLIKNKPKNIKLKILMFSKEDNLMVKY